MADFPSDPWFRELVQRINGSQEYREAAAGWEGDIAFAIEAEPDRGLPHDTWGYLDLWHGECRSGEGLRPECPRTPGTLVGQGRVVVPVEEDYRAAIQSGQDALADQLRASRHEQEHLGLGIHGFAVEQQLPHSIPQPGASGLPVDLHSAVRKPLSQQLQLRRFTRPLGTLEGYQQPSQAATRRPRRAGF